LSPPSPSSKSEDFDENFDQPTRAYDDFHPQEAKRSATPVEDEMTPVFDRPEVMSAPILQPKREEPPPSKEEDSAESKEVSSDSFLSSDASEPSSEAQESPSPSSIKPFGAETLFEIQKAERKRGLPKWLNAVALIIIILGVAYASLPYLKRLQLSSPTPVAEKIQIERPSGWYRDDAGVYQEEMVRQAGLPPTEKERPENVAVLSEALVLNGLLSNAQDQVNQGLLFAQKIQLEFPSSVAPLYSLSANAIAADQIVLMRTILDRWPEAYRMDPEYRLLEFMTLIREEKVAEGLQKAKLLLSEFPDFQRANDYALWMILQNGPVASTIIDRRFRDQLNTRYDSQRNLREKSMAQLPPLYLEIDRLLGRKPKTFDSKTEAPSARPEEMNPPPKAVETLASLPGGTPVPRITSTEPKIEPPKQKAKVKKDSKRLPPPSEDLVENTQADTKEKRDAKKLLAQGNELYRKGDVDGALTAYRKALKLDGSLAEVYKRLGILYMEQKRNDRASLSFKIYLQLQPQAKDRKEVEGWISKLR
jgi:tetratricopeptide (TPR) repeat protein